MYVLVCVCVCVRVSVYAHIYIYLCVCLTWSFVRGMPSHDVGDEQVVCSPSSLECVSSQCNVAVHILNSCSLIRTNGTPLHPSEAFQDQDLENLRDGVTGSPMTHTGTGSSWSEGEEASDTSSEGDPNSGSEDSSSSSTSSASFPGIGRQLFPPATTTEVSAERGGGMRKGHRRKKHRQPKQEQLSPSGRKRGLSESSNRHRKDSMQNALGTPGSGNRARDRARSLHLLMTRRSSAAELMTSFLRSPSPGRSSTENASLITSEDLQLQEGGFSMNPLSNSRSIRILPVKGAFDLDEEGSAVTYQRYAIIVEDVDSFDNTCDVYSLPSLPPSCVVGRI